MFRKVILSLVIAGGLIAGSVVAAQAGQPFDCTTNGDTVTYFSGGGFETATTYPYVRSKTDANCVHVKP